MHAIRHVRRRVREARYLDEPTHPVRWFLKTVADDLRQIVQVLSDLGQVPGGRS